MNPLTLIHILGGALALGAGAAALGFRKGSASHAEAGNIFLGSMLVLALTGAVMAALKPERATAVIGILTAYLVATAWWSARRRDGLAGRFEICALLVGIACLLAQLGFGIMAATSPSGRLDSLPAAAILPFAAIGAIAAGSDLKFILRGRLSGRQRIARHLWRMCTALFIAAASFFLGQQDEFPEWLRNKPIWFMPPFATLGLMAFWLMRIRHPAAFDRLTMRRRPQST